MLRMKHIPKKDHAHRVAICKSENGGHPLWCLTYADRFGNLLAEHPQDDWAFADAKIHTAQEVSIYAAALAEAHGLVGILMLWSPQ